MAQPGRGRKASGAAGTSHPPRARQEEGQTRPVHSVPVTAVPAAARTQAGLTVQETLDRPRLSLALTSKGEKDQASRAAAACPAR